MEVLSITGEKIKWGDVTTRYAGADRHTGRWGRCLGAVLSCGLWSQTDMESSLDTATHSQLVTLDKSLPS